MFMNRLTFGVLILRDQLAQIMRVISIISILLAGILILRVFLKEMGLPIRIHTRHRIKQFYYIRERISNQVVFNKPKIPLQIIGMVLTSRLLIFVLGYISIAMFQNKFVGLQEFLEVFLNRWDAPHIVSIAQNGYVTSGDERYFIVFYPLFPMLMRAVALIVRNYYVAGIIVSNVSLCYACIYLYKLAALDYDHKVSMRAVFLFLIFPMSFFCGIVYTESLFIALSIITFYYIRKQEWLNAGVIGLFAAFTRNFGVLLVVPLLIEILINIKNTSMKKKIDQVISLICIPIGLFLYLYVNKFVTGDWFTFLRYQKEHWHNEFGFLPDNIKKHVINMFDWDPKVSITMWIPQVICFLVILFVIFYAIKKMRISYSAYMLAYLMIAFSPSWLISGPRYIMAMFPIYLTFALLSKKEYMWYLIIMISTMFLSFYTIGFVNGYTIM